LTEAMGPVKGKGPSGPERRPWRAAQYDDSGFFKAKPR
jgi:hypothetical protein